MVINKLITIMEEMHLDIDMEMDNIVIIINIVIKLDIEEDLVNANVMLECNSIL